MESFNINELQTIYYACSILKTCNDVQPFALANIINKCGIATEAAIKAYNDELQLIREREQSAKDQEQIRHDLDDLVAKKFEVDLPEIRVHQFEALEISGDKEVPQQDGSIRKISYRDAYFNLLNIGLIKQ